MVSVLWIIWIISLNLSSSSLAYFSCLILLGLYIDFLSFHTYYHIFHFQKLCLVPNQIRLVFYVYFCPSSYVWTRKKAEHQRIHAFELWFWRRLLRVRWTARRLNQSILKEISPEYSLEGLMLKLKLQYFGYLIQRNRLIRKDHDAGEDWRQEGKGTTEDEMVGWHDWFNGHEFE